MISNERPRKTRVQTLIETVFCVAVVMGMVFLFVYTHARDEASYVPTQAIGMAVEEWIAMVQFGDARAALSLTVYGLDDADLQVAIATFNASVASRGADYDIGISKGRVMLDPTASDKVMIEDGLEVLRLHNVAAEAGYVVHVWFDLTDHGVTKTVAVEGAVFSVAGTWILGSAFGPSSPVIV